MTAPPRDATGRLGRALFFVQQQALAAHAITGAELIKAKIGTVTAAAKAMDFAVRVQGHPTTLTPKLVDHFALLAGISHVELVSLHLPMLKAADVVEYALVDGQVTGLEDFIGLSTPMLRQALRVFDEMGPKPVERAVLHCVEIASWAPLARAQHLEQITGRGYDDKTAAEALQITLALGINRKIASAGLREDVVFNPNVWASGQEDVAKFLKGLPPGERDALLGMCEQASSRPGLALPSYAGFAPSIMASATKVGLIQAATVKSTASFSAGAQTYLFSPVLETVDDAYKTTEALHHRKLFVAHILYGVEKAQSGLGKIGMPLRLVSALAGRGTVGPATDISTDYHLLEAQGIVAVRDAGDGRSYLDAVKTEIIEGGLAWLSAAAGGDTVGGGSAESVLGQLRPPQSFATPEASRVDVGDLGESDEITTSAVFALRKLRQEAQRVVRFDFT